MLVRFWGSFFAHAAACDVLCSWLPLHVPRSLCGPASKGPITRGGVIVGCSWSDFLLSAGRVSQSLCWLEVGLQICFRLASFKLLRKLGTRERVAGRSSGD